MAEKDISDVSEQDSAEKAANSQKEEFVGLIKQGFDALMPAIRASNSLPKGHQWDLLCTSPRFKPTMDSLGKKSLDLIALILHHQGINRDIRKRDLEEKYELVVETNDKILERVGTHLDELSGIRRNPIQPIADIAASPVIAASGSWNKNVTNSARWKEVSLNKSSPNPVVLRNARITQRPQAKFHDKIDNSSTPFEPRIKEKPNALKPLAILYEDLPGEDACYSHPYEFELDRFQEKIDTINLERKKPQPPKPIEETPLIFVTEEAQLMELLEDLKTQKEIAIDLEHHSYRSFQGFLCLMQISTHLKDYIIDTLELRHKLHVLNEVFTDPKIVKVFHGADSDIIWLQRDLSLYVVNMFDTYQASLMLSLPRLSLAYLLKSICNVDANKTFQMYDWRTRPLAKEAIKYAREDTHYLLYIYEVLWNQLLEKSNGGTQLLQTVLFRSTDTCKKRYWKSIYKEDSYDKIYRSSRKNFDNRQMYALKEVYAWRDKVAREEDESVGYVLPNHMLLLIAEKLPKEMQGILACCNPIPPLVRQNLVLLHQIVLKAREQPLVTRIPIELSNETRLRPTPQTNVNLEGALHCPHDLTYSADFRDDLPTLLNSTLDINSNISLMESKPTLNIFGEDKEDDSNLSIMNLPNQIHFMSPFDRYKKMLLYVESEEAKTNEEREKQLAEDTRKLLDECMRERQKNASGGSEISPNIGTDINIKQEKQGYSHSRKRNRSPSMNNDSIVEEKLNVTIKSESSVDEVIPVNTNSFEIHSNVESNSSMSGMAQYMNVKTEKDVSYEENGRRSKKKRKKHNNNQPMKVLPMNVGAKRKNTFGEKRQPGKFQDSSSSESVTQYDYSQVDYNQFQQTGTSNPNKKARDNFKPKGKKKQQNKSFTFARQFGNAGSRTHF